jgi:hypothetical protein
MRPAVCFAALAASDVFAQASVELGVVTWPNDADLDPLWIYGLVKDNKTWPVSFDAFAALLLSLVLLLLLAVQPIDRQAYTGQT